jgi:hypothetical protein
MLPINFHSGVTEFLGRLHILNRKLAPMCGTQGDQGIFGGFLTDLRLKFLTVGHLFHELFEILFAHGFSPSMRPVAVADRTD